MESEYDDLIERFCSTGILKETQDGQLSLTDTFKNKRRRQRKSFPDVESAEYEELHNQFLDSTNLSSEEITDQNLIDTMLIQKLVDAVSFEEAIVGALSLEVLDNPPETSGLPEGFIPLRGSDLESFTSQYSTSIVYFWKDDCQPCEQVRDRLENICQNEHIPDDIGFGAVYGPNWAETLKEQYGVGVAPTVIFFKDGVTDSRIIGDTSEQAIKQEIAITTG
ncbi:thioredoxin family protein [Halopenitus persicus]|uniref:thioredoxin family protein n=1 Tax=Halopenitus persicus TaxID=1048396 RepID=UPI000BBB029F|nr:thioredoxin family protein [Halopenitus persicus]